jgi:5-hydroxyisourate hydrolase
MTGAGISTHVLDTTRGAPAAGVAVTVNRREGRDLVLVGSGTTGEDGRVANLLTAELMPGWYQLVFDLAPYYGSQPHFFSRVTLDVAIAEARQHHVPLLISPFSCSSYRGS